MSMRGKSLLGQVLATRYEVVEYLDSGALGDIYKARDKRLSFREVALKVLRPDTPEDQVARFKREALLAGGLSSPHLTRTSDFGVLEDGRAWLAMEYLEGESLATLLSREGTLGVARAAKIVDGILAGLEAAHAAGVVHRDLKPSNIFVVEEPGVRDHAKLLDFGFAKVYEGDQPALDVTGEEAIVVGTVSYMAPEQLRGQRTGPAADLYSVGLVLFRALSGELPYVGAGADVSMLTAARFRAATLDQPPRALVSLGPRFEGLAALSAVIDRALAPKAEDRFPSAGAMRRALAEAVDVALPPEPSASGARPKAGAERWRSPDAEDPLAVPSPSGRAVADRPHPGLLWGGAVGLLLVVAYFVWRASA